MMPIEILIDQLHGKEAIIALRKGNAWYIEGINAERRENRKTIKYKHTLIADGIHYRAFVTQYMVVDKSSAVDVGDASTWWICSFIGTGAVIFIDFLQVTMKIRLY